MSNNVFDFPTSSLIGNDALIVDLARFAEGSLTKKQVRKRYKFSETIWQRMAEDERLDPANRRIIDHPDRPIRRPQR